ncbi:2-oxoglutarate dehydrogenase complex dihydrolipoyllysine-residue succinyltransferase [Candidatus Marithrix sp. Canyon 246]|uniref:2-oxoglutarate dehydrogenase complex dihydrolipoyllysine-residue succinyltransferase n=1 Tax=Candidatus Marithrix sp. Canyon 246 TaxID=1827136 RepID=UPI00084A0D18|nr:2-oxoglutarate dehydrogenase complex dihydrolipoyllysine-residue succinyltransferase [Candidatus Marithrix sp. Canyon 246]
MSIEEVKVPELAESVSEATILKWHKQQGDVVNEDEKLVDIETDKIILEVTAPKAGTLIKIIKNADEYVESSEDIALIETNPAYLNDHAKTSPAVRKIAAEQGVDPDAVPHEGDRVTKSDLVKPASKAVRRSAKTLVATNNSPSTITNSRSEKRVPMNSFRKRVAERLVAVQHESAILTTFNEINMKAVKDLRGKYKANFEAKYDVKLGFMSFFTKAVVSALQQFPIVNASIDGEEIVYHNYNDIGIAVSSPRGLVVPILRDVEKMSFAEIEQNISQVAKRANNGELTMDELSGGTFSITNGGIFGSMLSTPILNPPQSAILGMHNIVERPVAENGEVVIRPIMYVALSYDHRLIDGRDAVQFLVAIKNAIEDPSRLLLDI